MSKRSRGQAALDKHRESNSSKKDLTITGPFLLNPINEENSDAAILRSNYSYQTKMKNKHLDFEEKFSYIYSIFRSLDLVIHSFKMKNLLATWHEVIESLNLISGLLITVTDLTIIKFIYPLSYNFNWKVLPYRDREKSTLFPNIDLIISIPSNEELNSSDKINNLTIQSRLHHFR